ncbi:MULTISPECIES: hypothetical protein [Paraburkholderia]|uniref:hypothetical protein n=1 Tax=Paraburkholderia TaxID=1822464 RepID=UPI0014962226|nr:hypothetical protein [Paraburkholderia fungorum]
MPLPQRMKFVQQGVGLGRLTNDSEPPRDSKVLSLDRENDGPAYTRHIHLQRSSG